jgi:hypothetical protein
MKQAETDVTQPPRDRDRGKTVLGRTGPFAPFRALGAAIAHIMGHVTISFVANVTAVILSIPLLLALAALSFALHSYALIPLGIIILLGILPSPTSCGLQFLASELAHGEMVSLSDLRTGLRDYWRVALRTWLVSLAVMVLILVNLAFYAGQISSTGSPLHAVAGPATALWVFALLLWTAMHLYVFPLLLAQEDRSLRTTYRNALVIVVSRPLFTVIVLLAWLLILTFTAFTGLSSVIGLVLAAALQQDAMARLLSGPAPRHPSGRQETYSEQR